MNWKEFYEEEILKATTYSGNKEPGRKQFSGSMIGNTTLQNYLKFKNGSKDDNVFGANTHGSVYHLGAETIFNKVPDTATEVSFSYRLCNGWLITGTIDLMLKNFKMIVDHKVTTSTTIQKVRKEGKYNNYALQQAVYRWLVYKNTDETYNCGLGVVDKNHSHFKENKNRNLEPMDLDVYDFDEIEELLINKTNELQEYIDLDQEPPQCTSKEKWIYARKGKKAKAMRCHHYCDQNVNCQYFSEYSATKELLDL